MALYRIYNLVLLQLGNRFNFVNKRKSTWIKASLLTCACIAITLVFTILFVLFRSVIQISLTPDLLFFLVVITQIISLISSVANMTTHLYTSKDNAILLAMPAEHTEVFYSKLIVSFINEFLRNLFILLPLFVGFGIAANVGVWYYISVLLTLLLLPYLSVMLGALISIPFMYVVRLFKKYPIIYVVVMTFISVGVLLLIKSLLAALPQPLLFKDMLVTVVKSINVSLGAIAGNSLFFVWIADVMFLRSSTGTVLNASGEAIKVLVRARSSVIDGGLLWVDSIFWLLLLVAVLFVANLLLSRPLFFRLASHSSESTRQKKYKGKITATKSTYIAFVQKEFKLSLRNVGVLFKEYILIVMLPFVLYLVNGILNSMNLNILGDVFVTGINTMIGLMFITASNSASATALSKEGGEFVLLKTAPSNTRLITWAKMTINIIVSTLFIVISILVMGIVGTMSVVNLLRMFAIFVICNAGHILWSLQIDIRNPLMSEYASTGEMENNQNISRSILVGLLLSVIVGVLSIVLYYLLNETTAFAILLAISIVFCMVRIYLFNLNLKCLFSDIEL